MNFNLISPEGNGHTYNVRFAEPIIIPENASIHLNWGQFERDSKVRFSEAQTLTLNLEDPDGEGAVLPFWDWHNDGNGAVNGVFRKNGTERNTGDLSISIPAGTYSMTELQTKISEGFQGGTTRLCEYASDNRQGKIDYLTNATNPSLKLNKQMFVVPPVEDNPNYLEFGIVNTNFLESGDIGTYHKKDITATPFGSVAQPNFDVVKTAGTADGSFEDGSGTPDAGTTKIDSYNAYALWSAPYNHRGTSLRNFDNNGELKPNAFDDTQYGNTIHCTLDQLYDEMQGNVFVGLYSNEYAGVNAAGFPLTSDIHLGTQNNTSRTNGAHLQNIPVEIQHSGTGDNGYIPQCYFGVEIVGEHGAGDEQGVEGRVKPNTLNCYSTSMGNSTNNFDTNITTAQWLLSVDLDGLRDPADDTPVQFFIQTYKHDLDDVAGRAVNTYLDLFDADGIGQTHIRVIVPTKYTNRPNFNKVVFDSGNAAMINPATIPNVEPYLISFSSSFLDSMKFDLTADNNAGNINVAQARASGFPFAPFVAFTEAGEGAFINYTPAPNQVSSAPTGPTLSHLIQYSMTATRELANLIHTTTSKQLKLETKLACSTSILGMVQYMKEFYNNEGGIQGAHFSHNPFIYRDNNIIPQAITDKFSVVMNNLPIKSYKNTNDKSKSGYRKPILANIPAPFAGSRTDVSSDGTIVGSYQSSLGIVNRLSNQVITTNNFDMQILDLESDKPAEQLTKSIINFTISAE